MYGAFLLERMHDDDMDLLRKRQILQGLVDEFEDYEKVGSASSSLMKPTVFHFSSYGQGSSISTPIPYGGMASVNTGIWEAMLQSGGIEVLEVDNPKGAGLFKSCRTYSIYIPGLRDSPNR